MARPDDPTHDRPPTAGTDVPATVLPPVGMTPAVILGKSHPPALLPAAGEWAPPGYSVERELGRGGMGVVYLAHQAGLNRPVALKLIKAGDADSVSVIRFLAEAEAMAAVRHPNVAQVYQYGEHEGRPFLALEYCNGGNLQDRIASHRQGSAVESAKLLAQIADGVQAAHAAGIVHRDLKPGNILFDAAGVPKVTDFGLAKRATGSDLTQTNAIMGTPAYMSPEQARGQGKFADPRADVWALGVILYELLAGRRPFDGETPMDLLQRILDSTPASAQSVSAGVPRDLDLICGKCLRKDVAERYATAGDLADDLRRFLAGQPILARPASKAAQAWKWAKRNRGLAGSLATTAVALVTGTVVALAYARESHRLLDQARQAETERKAAIDREKEAVRKFLQFVVSRPELPHEQRKTLLAEFERANPGYDYADLRRGLGWAPDLPKADAMKAIVAGTSAAGSFPNMFGD